jgi:hypothetical protein
VGTWRDRVVRPVSEHLGWLFAVELLIVGLLLVGAIWYWETSNYDRAAQRAQAAASCEVVDNPSAPGSAYLGPAGGTPMPTRESCASVNLYTYDEWESDKRQTAGLVLAAALVMGVLAIWTRGSMQARRRARELGIGEHRTAH